MIKKVIILLFATFIISMSNLLAQGVAINSDGSNADVSAMLDVKSSVSGVLIPRMTKAIRDVLSSPAKSLLIFQTDNTPGYYYNSGTPATPIWERLATGEDLGFVDGTGTATRVAFWTNTNILGSNANLFWDNTNGRLGIGTSSPQEKLHIVSNSGTGYPSILLENTLGHSWKFWAIDGNDLRVSDVTDGVDRLTIKGISGNVGIGSTSPSSKLHILGTIAGDGTWNQGILIENNNTTAGEPAVAFKNSATGSNYWLTGLNQSAHYDIAYGTTFTNGNTKMRIQTDGKIGIGTVSPSSQLHLTQDMQIGTDAVNRDNMLTFWVENGYEANLVMRETPNHGIGIRYNATNDKLYIDRYANSTTPSPIITILRDSEKIGIGTTSPTSQLHTTGTVRFANLSGTGNRLVLANSDGVLITGEISSSGKCYTLPNTGSSAQWVKLGTLTISQQGKSAFFHVIINAGYNANINQNADIYIRFKTSNGSSFDGNGFAGDGTYYTEGKHNQFFTNNRIKFVANAAGVSATSFDLYMYFNPYTGSGSFYEILSTEGTWSHSGTIASDPGVASSTIMVPTQEFNIGAASLVVDSDGEVGIGTTSPSEKLHVSSNKTLSAIYGYNYRSTSGANNIGVNGYATGTTGTSYGNTGVYGYGANNSNNTDYGPSDSGLDIGICGEVADSDEDWAGWFSGDVYALNYYDVAEMYSDVGNIPDCALVSLNEAANDPAKVTVKISTKAYDENLIGIKSENPAIYIGATESSLGLTEQWETLLKQRENILIIMNSEDGENWTQDIQNQYDNIENELSKIRSLANPKGEGDNGSPIALVGRVRVNANTENGSIKPGDPITSSNIPGQAMKATQAGPIIGFAYSELNEGKGKIVVNVSRTYYTPSVNSELNLLKQKIESLEKRISDLEK